MGNGRRWKLGGRNGIVTVRGREKPGLLEQRDWTSDRAPNVVKVEIRVRVVGLKRRWREHGLPIQIVQRPRSQRGVLIVVERRSVIVRATSFGGDPNVGDARIFRAEIRGQKINLADTLQRRLACGRHAKDSAI